MEDSDSIARLHWSELTDRAAPARARRRLDPLVRGQLIIDLCGIAPLSIRDLSQLLDRTEAYTGDAIRPLIEAGRLGFLHPDQPRHPKQRYTAVGSPAETAGRLLVRSEQPTIPLAAPDEPAALSSELSAKENLASKVWPELEQAARFAREHRRLAPDVRDALVVTLCSLAPLSARELAALMNRSEAYVSDAIQPLVKASRISFLYSDQPRHPRQKYMTIAPAALAPDPSPQPSQPPPRAAEPIDAAPVPVLHQQVTAPPRPAPIHPAAQVSAPTFIANEVLRFAEIPKPSAPSMADTSPSEIAPPTGTAQEQWAVLEQHARPARENRYLGGVEFAALLREIASLAPVSPRELAILTDRKEDYIRQLCDGLVDSGQLRVLTDSSSGQPRQKYWAIGPTRISDIPVNRAAKDTAEIPPLDPASPFQIEVVPSPASHTPARPLDRVPARQPPSPLRSPPAPASKPARAAAPVPTTPVPPVGEDSQAAAAASAADPADAPRPSFISQVFNPLTSLISAILTGSLLGMLEVEGWWRYGLFVAALMASLHLVFDSVQYRRFRALNPRQGRQSTFWLLKALAAFAEIGVVYATVATFVR